MNDAPVNERASEQAPQLHNEVRNTVKEEVDLKEEVDPETARRWASEAAFFDHYGDQLLRTLRPFTPVQLRRYVAHPGRIYDKEYRFRLLGDLQGKRVLDLGCGDGSNSVLLAKVGAVVHGADVSSKMIQVAERRALLNGVSDRTTFTCGPAERLAFKDDSFDIIWGDGILHHLIDDIEGTLAHLVRWAKPGALFLFSEPVNLNPALRRLRLEVPIHTDATPDERPLEKRELAVIRRYLPSLKMRHFHCLSRFTRFVVPLDDYESAPWRQRAVADAIHAVDYAALGVPLLRTLGGMCVMWARLEKPGIRGVD